MAVSFQIFSRKEEINHSPIPNSIDRTNNPEIAQNFMWKMTKNLILL